MANVEIYTKDYCPFCHRAKALLRSKNIAFREYDVTRDATGFAEMVERSGRRTVPQTFVNGQHIGGSDDLFALELLGELDALFGARAA